MTFIERTLPVAAGFALAILLGVLIRARAQDSGAGAYPPVSNMFVVNQTLCLAPQVDEASGMCKPVAIAAGAMITLQLPGTPAVWSIVSASPNLVATGPVERIPNPDRLPGTSELFSWQFHAARAGEATLVMREFPPAISTTPRGTFTYTFQIR